MRKKIFCWIVTLGPIGYLPAPGTMSTLFSLVLIMLFNFLKLSLLNYLTIILVTILFGFYAIYKSLFYFGTFNNDPREIVIDELIGTLITFIAIPFNAYTILLGTLLFRFFDIVKPLGIKKIERCGKYFGILADDIVAGIFSNIILHCVTLCIKF